MGVILNKYDLTNYRCLRGMTFVMGVMPLK